MNVSILKGVALCGLSLLLAGVGSAASAQTYRHARPSYQSRQSRERAAILRQKAAYARAVANGRYRAAERAHLRASAIRQHVRTQRQTHTAYHR